MTTTTNRPWFIKSYICHVKAHNWTLNYNSKNTLWEFCLKYNVMIKQKGFFLSTCIRIIILSRPKILTLGGLCQTSISCRSAYFAFFNLWANNICTILCSAYIILTIQLYCKDHLRFAINFNMYDVWTWYLTVNRGLVFFFF